MLENWINRTDCHGAYSKNGQYTSKGEITDELVDAHFSGSKIIGIHAITLDQTCRWVAWDIDAHHGESAEENETTARTLVADLIGQGYDPLLEDSDGRGGFHVWVLFDKPAPAVDAYEFAQTMAPPGVEALPKQASINPQKGTKGHYGNWLRLPGKHHKREHWSQFWSGFDWTSWNDGAREIMDDPALSPAPPKATGKVRVKVGKGADPLDLSGGGAPPISDSVGAGRRNAVLTSIAGSMRHRGMGESAITAALLAENREKCKPPLEDSEVEKIATSIVGYEPGSSVYEEALQGGQALRALNERLTVSNPRIVVERVIQRGLTEGHFELHIGDRVVVIEKLATFKVVQQALIDGVRLVLPTPMSNGWHEVAQLICDAAEFVPTETRQDETLGMLHQALRGSSGIFTVESAEDLEAIKDGRTPTFEFRGDTFVVITSLCEFLGKKGHKLKGTPDLSNRLTSIGCLKKRIKATDDGKSVRMVAYMVPPEVVEMTNAGDGE